MDHVLATMESWLQGEPVWPYAKIIESWGEEFEDWRKKMSRKLRQAEKDGVMRFDSASLERIGRGLSIWATRDQWTHRYGFAIPCAELLDELAKHQPIVEVGAGSGYMTRLMMHRGIDVIGSNPTREDYGWVHGMYADLVASQAKTMARNYPKSTIFCSWPTYRATWFHQMLKAMSIGQKLVVIRESACATEEAWEYLDERFEELAVVELPVFEHISDYAQVWIKKRR